MPKVTEEHRLARRQQIVEAARGCVVEQGFHKTTMADVIRASGLSAGAVYGYFKSKDELVAAIADDAVGTVDQLFGSLLDRPGPLSLPQVVKILLDHITRMANLPGGDVTRVAVQAWAEAVHNPVIAGIVREKYTRVRGHFTDAVRRAQADGTVDPDTDPEHIAQVLFGSMQGFVLQRLLLGDVTTETYTAGLAALMTRPGRGSSDA